MIMKDYFQIILSAIVGSAFTVIIQSIPIIYRYFKDFKTRSLCNMKYSYIWVTLGDVVKLQKYNIEIKKAFLSDYTAHATFIENPKRAYKGKGSKQNETVYFTFESEGLEVKDYSYHRYNINRLEDDNFCLGYWLSTNMSNTVSCGGAILSAKELNEDSLIEYKNKYAKFKDEPVMYVHNHQN